MGIGYIECVIPAIIGDFIVTLAQKTQTNQSSLDQEIRTLLARSRPHKIVETGTHLGLGSTLTICESLAENGLAENQFYSIEVNPNFYAQAWTNLGQRGFHPRLLRGLSIPRSLLPSEADLRRETGEHAGAAAEVTPEARVAAYQQETHFPEALDDLLGFVLRNMAPDFMMLDSAAHLGFIEFQYAIALLKAPCYLALNGVFHAKHARSLAVLESDARFKLLVVSRENSGWCLAHFKP